MILFLDIETLPTDNADVIAEIAAGISPPGNIKKAESIAEWHKENGQKAIAEAVAKTSFNGLYGRIACMAWAIDDGEIHATTAEDSEAFMLETLRLVCNAASHSPNVQFCGHNLAGFDLPFIKHRSIIHRVRPHRVLEAAINAKPWDSCILDTMLMWSQDREKRTSMDSLCRAFGIEGKGDFDGSQVANEWANGSKEKVISYCKDDVERTRKLYKRMTFQSEQA